MIPQERERDPRAIIVRFIHPLEGLLDEIDDLRARGRGPVRVTVGEPTGFTRREGESNKAFELRILEEMKVALEDLVE